MPRIRAANIEQHKELTRRQLLDATRQLLAEVGYEMLTIGDVAAAAGIGRTTIYQYFRDKEDVLASLVEETLPEVIEDIIASIPEDLPVERRLTALAEATVGFVASDPVLGLVLHRDVSKLSESTQERIRGAHRDLSAEIAHIYTVGVEQGRFRPLPPRLVGRFIQDLIMSAARYLVDAPDPRRVAGETAGAMAEFLLHGLSVR
jgi:AcrR family transcriptional regulator